MPCMSGIEIFFLNVLIWIFFRQLQENGVTLSNFDSD